MKTILLALLFVNTAFIGMSQLMYSKVRIQTNAQGLHQLWLNGLAVDHGIYKEGAHFTTNLSSDEIRVLDSLGFSYEIVIADVIEHYQSVVLNQLQAEYQRNINCNTSTSTNETSVPVNFTVPTTYGGFFKYQEMLNQLDQMNRLYPNLISQRSAISSFVTYENRTIQHVRISNSPNMDNGNPRVLYTAIHHAREPLSMSQLLFYMWYLLENYGTNPEVTFLVDNTQLFFVPCINPDGYVYNETNTPNGGGMHRKNRRPVGTTNRGVDLNRNYSYQWGTTGISTNVNNDTYPGSTAFSEPETQAIRWLVRTYNITSGFNAHTHGNDILFPIGSTANEFAEHHDYLENLAGHFCRENGYGYFKSSGLYPASGDSDDYMYKVDVGVQQKDTMFVMTPEIGTAFWPPRAEIIPTSIDMLQPNLGIAHMVHKYYIGQSIDPVLIENREGQFTIGIKKLGRRPGSTSVTLIPVENLESVGASQTITYALIQTGNLVFNYSLVSNIVSGDQVRYILEVNDGVYIQRDTVVHQFGTPFEVVLAESGTNTNNWTGSWSTTTSTYYSAPRSFSDSPSGDYGNNANSAFTLNQTIDLREATDAKVNFWAKWALEAGYDYTQFQVSTDNGTNWVGQCGRFTVNGVTNQGGVQPLGQPLWSGSKTSWVEEEIDLTDYIGQQIKLRFLLRSDGSTRGDGFYFDDFKVSVRYVTDDPVDPTDPENPVDPTDPENPGNPTDPGVSVDNAYFQGFKVYPNPFKNRLKIDGDLAGVSINVYDMSGRKIDVVIEGNYLITEEITQGTYVLILSNENSNKYFKIVK